MVRKKKIKVYVGCALTHASDSFKQDIIKLKEKLKRKYEILEFLGQGLEYTPEQVFLWDINCVRSCDVLIANVTYPSIGLGAEFGTAIERNKPIITIAEETARVSRFVYGYKNKNYFTKRYASITDAVVFIDEKIQELFPSITLSGE